MKMNKKRIGAIIAIVVALVLVVSVIITINPTVKYNEDGTYAHFTENDSYVSVFKHPAFEGYGRFLIPLSTDIGRSFGVFGKIGTTNGAWSCNQDLLEAVNACIDQVNTGDPLFYDYYTAEEIAADNSKADTCIAFLKGEPGKPFIVLNGGGGYQDVAFLAEGVSSGVPFWEAGYNVFVVKYRAEFDLPNELGMSGFDIAIGDLGRAMQFIYAHAEEFEIDTTNYAIAGFSAGGNLTQGWGTTGVGYDVYDIPKPTCVMLIYGGGIGDLGGFDGSVIPEDYPAFFAISTEEDMQQIREGTKGLDTLADEYGIEHFVEIYNKGTHGFGRGTNTDAEGWPEKAMMFWESLA